MPEVGGDAEAAADRLEAALERIASLAARPPATASADAPPELADRIDALIAQLRAALDGPAA
jgi:hypothetical protein